MKVAKLGSSRSHARGERQPGTRFDVPFFFFQDESDVITLTTLATDYYVQLRSASKCKILSDVHTLDSVMPVRSGMAGVILC
jgi:hypothetical protein